ncbi:alkaline-phosphatase-like protein [Aspergillus floccosus]
METKRPNILYIMADQMAAPLLSIHDPTSPIKTPNLDRLARDGLHGYEQRLTSDIYPGDYGWSVNWDEPDVRLDYYHNMSSVLDAGPVVRTNQLDFDEEVVYKSTQYLYDQVRYRNDQPFCLTVSMTHPHDPYAITKEFWDLYEDVEIPLPKHAAIPHDQQDAHSQRVLKCIDLWNKELPEDRIRAARRAYYAACTYVDTNIGKLLRVLEETGLSENTIIVFTGDHGDMLGERGLWYKMTWFENSARVPMIFHAPKHFSPHRVSENVSTMDLLPTFAELVGAQLVPGLPLDGVSLVPHLTGGEGLRTDTVYGEYMGEGTQAPVIMIRRGRWKFVYSAIDPPMLFDLVNDPEEKTNLVAGLPVLSVSSPTVPTKPMTSSPAGLPTPMGTPRASPKPQDTNQAVLGSVKLLPTPEGMDPVRALGYFLAEVNAHWDLEKIRQDVLHSQRRRRLVYSALIKGTIQPWDYEPRVDPTTQYVRNHGKGVLDDVEFMSRWPRILQQAANANNLATSG